MLWAYVCAGALGLLLGTRYRVPAAIAASALAMLAGPAVAVLAGWSIGPAFAIAFGAVASLQCGYLLGLLLMCAASRISSSASQARRS